MIYMPWNEFCMIRVIWEVSDSFSREVWSSSLPSDHDLTKGGSPPPKIEKSKFVLKWFSGNFKCFKLMFFFKKKKNNGKSVRCWPHPPTLTENSVNSFFFFFNPSFWYLFRLQNHIQQLMPLVFQISILHLENDVPELCWNAAIKPT